MRKVLIANRGEIAVRIIRACRDLGLHSVAIFSDPDRGSLHVTMADEAYRVGPAPAEESYLDQERIVEVAHESGADTIHPGYGFLAENADFAERCEQANLTFVGPPADAIRVMGDKTAARKLMEEANVPTIPGSSEALREKGRAEQVAQELGYPVLIKAAAGGGGKGMRVVKDSDELEPALQAAQREAQSAFGDPRVYLEKYIAEPRHIEFQIIADEHGNAVHLFERECSVQRRHQKVIEEAPANGMTSSLRAEMGRSAVTAATEAGYTNAGTVEFLVDADNKYYFLEMNTRLQVEHPVTECITRVDLVVEQLRVAMGKRLSWTQDELSIEGHAIESRIYAEDPANDFLPDSGALTRHRPPSGPGVRLDSGVEEGNAIPVHYDPMIAKLVVWGETREKACIRMRRALGEYEIGGVTTTIPFCRYVIEHPVFDEGEYTTQFVDRHYEAGQLIQADEHRDRAAALAAVLFRQEHRKHASRDEANNASPSQRSRSPWVQRRWR